MFSKLSYEEATTASCLVGCDAMRCDAGGSGVEERGRNQKEDRLLSFG